MLRAAIIGATGYTGAELVRLLHGHPSVEVTAYVGHSTAGQRLADVLPGTRGILDAEVETFDAGAIAERADVAFTALPHGASAPSVRALRQRGTVVLDLSADFRLRDLGLYARWYGEHGAPELNDAAVYGLVELTRDAITRADLIAVPGCYPTAAILAGIPMVRAGLRGPLIVDAKSGTSGAGRLAKARTHFSETSEGVRGYAVGGRHRHTPEMEQALGHPVVFSPHLVPMIRGILATVYARCDASDVALTESARAMYAGSPSVVVLDAGDHPDTQWVRASNRALISYRRDEARGVVVAQAAIDNLVKGAAGQAVQCMNVRFGFDEGAGLVQPAAWP